MTDIDLPMLRVLRLKGMAGEPALAAALRVDGDTVARRVAALVAAQDARALPRGVALTPQGRATMTAALDAERATIDAAAMAEVYDRFCAVNGRFKALMKDWQLRLVDGVEQPNDHTDAAYDAGILSRLNETDADRTPISTDAAALAPRLAPYHMRFADALDAVRQGDWTMVAAPIKDSYHTVWFEFHEELIGLSGTTRAIEAAAGRGD